MTEWLSTKQYDRLTEDEVKAELENLLRNCEDEEEFKKECQHRFGGPMIAVIWGKISRSAMIHLRNKKKSNSANVG